MLTGITAAMAAILMLAHDAAAPERVATEAHDAAISTIAPGDVNLTPLFDTHQAVGTAVVKRLSDGAVWTHDVERAQTAFPPASTYKIPHTLIALETGAVRDLDEVIPWDGVERSIASWNRDHTLRTAVPFSVYPAFQTIARRVGYDAMQYWLDQMDYGNRQIGAALDAFWLTGPMKITARQQVRFMEKLALNDTPFDKAHVDALKDIIIVDQAADWTLRGKTGWTNEIEPGIGWFVGWLDVNVSPATSDIYVFAVNIDMTDFARHRPARLAIAREILGRIGAFPDPYSTDVSDPDENTDDAPSRSDLGGGAPGQPLQLQ